MRAPPPPPPQLLTTDQGVDADLLVRDIEQLAKVSEQVADECNNVERAKAIRDLAAAIRASAAKFESTSAGAAQDELAELLRQQMFELEQQVRSAAAGTMSEAAIASNVVAKLVARASNPDVTAADFGSDLEKLRVQTARLVMVRWRLCAAFCRPLAAASACLTHRFCFSPFLSSRQRKMSACSPRTRAAFSLSTQLADSLSSAASRCATARRSSPLP